MIHTRVIEETFKVKSSNPQSWREPSLGTNWQVYASSVSGLLWHLLELGLHQLRLNADEQLLIRL